MSDEFVIETRGLVKRYGSHTAVAGIDLAIRPGEIYGLLGPNGAGKTTTILMLLGLTERTSGSVDVAGFDPARQPLEVKRRVGYMPDAVGFYDNLTARQNLLYTAKLSGMLRGETKDRIEAALNGVRLTAEGNQRVATYSRGMRQRLGLAEIRMKKCRIAILDEPTSGLDPQATLELLDMIRHLKQDGIAVLISSHLLDRVQAVCDRVALFNKGRIALQGTVPELGLKVLGGAQVIDLEATGGDVKAAIGAVPGLGKVTETGANRYAIYAERELRPELTRALVERNCNVIRLATQELSLEAIYTHYFEEAANAA